MANYSVNTPFFENKRKKRLFIMALKKIFYLLKFYFLFIIVFIIRI